MSKDKTFEENLVELEFIVSSENGKLTLEDSLKEILKGIELTEICNKKLNGVESRS